MVITSAVLNNLRTTFNIQFKLGYSKAPTFWAKVATEAPSDSTSNTYGFLARNLKMREWVGPRIVNNLAEYSYVLGNKDFEETVAVKRNDIEDDKLGVYNTPFQQLGEAAALHPDQLLASVIQAGTTTLCFDGQNFFDTDHPISLAGFTGGIYSNNFNLALTADNYETVRAEMMAYKDDSGDPLGIIPNLLVVPPALEVKAKRIVISQTVPSFAGTASEDNQLRGTADLLMVPWLTDTTAWYLLDVRRAIKPFIFQRRRAPQLITKTAVTDDNVFWLKEYVWGVDSRDNAGYSLPFLAARSKP